MIFKDRHNAGLQLADKLMNYKNTADTVVLGLPRGGIPVAAVVAQKLNLTLNVIIVRKIGAPHNPELAVGAITEGSIQILDKRSMKLLNLNLSDLQNIIDQEQVKIKERLEKFRQQEFLSEAVEKTIILVDDGVATGLTAKAAAKFAKKNLKPKKVVLATPVISLGTAQKMNQYIDKVIAIHKPVNLQAVGQFYYQFDQVNDDEVIEALRLNEAAPQAHA